MTSTVGFMTVLNRVYGPAGFGRVWRVPKQALVFTYLPYLCFENTMGKGESARKEQVLLFPK